MIKVAITGSTGLIGSRIIELLDKDFRFIPLTHDRIDITNSNNVNQTLKNIDFDFLLHLAAFTNVDQAEKEKEMVYRINVDGTDNLFTATQDRKKKLIFISTDFVFDGNNPPYTENSQPRPISYYGITKYEGEKIVNNKAMVVRVSYPYRSNFDKKRDFVRVLKSSLEQDKQLSMLEDSIMTPTFVDDIAYALKYLINNYSPEVFHIVGADSLTPYDAAKLIAGTFKLNENLISKVKYDEFFQNKAKRPKLAKIISVKNSFFRMKTFEEGLRSLQNQMQ